MRRLPELLGVVCVRMCVWLEWWLDAVLVRVHSDA